MTGFKDHFSRHAALYRRYRPALPPEVFAWLAGLAPARERAWDAGTGNGQAALLLADHFEEVVASDASAAQIAEATPHPRVRYTVATAEASGLPDHSVDLAVSTQALHWFDHDRYYAEVRRVVRPGGVVAGLTYTHPTIDPAIDPLLWRYIAHVHADWPPERRFVDAGYTNLPFPFDELALPAGWALTQALDLEGFHGYLATWSAAQRYLERTGEDPRAGFYDALVGAWGDPTTTKVVRWPLAGRVGRVLGSAA
ncbi:MAG: class I SAM-dependent methyltransferase [Deltaproteobacteria bacterium]|nr:class I SAM-dependent methyltransferase [Deltaproteobacteria bacterium]